jgi:hypothetical protein
VGGGRRTKEEIRDEIIEILVYDSEKDILDGYFSALINEMKIVHLFIIFIVGGPKGSCFI